VLLAAASYRLRLPVCIRRYLDANEIFFYTVWISTHSVRWSWNSKGNWVCDGHLYQLRYYNFCVWLWSIFSNRDVLQNWPFSACRLLCPKAWSWRPLTPAKGTVSTCHEGAALQNVFRCLVTEPTFTDSCLVESKFPQVLAEILRPLRFYRAD
jgi:hypothetical protein